MRIHAVVVTAFEPDAGPVLGEFRHFREREAMTEEIAFPQGYRPLWLNRERGVLGLVTGVGAVRAAASVMALGMDPRFDLREALWLISGVAGAAPERATLGSVVLPAHVVDGNFAHEIDAREMPGDWPDGFVPIGKSTPYEEPLAQRFNGDDGIVFRLSPERVAWATEACAGLALEDSEKMAARRQQFGRPDHLPEVVRGDELCSTTFWHGRLLSQRAARWVAYQTEGAGSYTFTAMEDTGILQALTFLAQADKVDFSRLVIARGISNFDQQRGEISAAESLAETRVATYSAYLPALENAWRVGNRILHAWLTGAP